MNENENYIMLNGKKIPLTDEQVKLMQENEVKKSPFDRVANNNIYYYIDCDFDVIEDFEDNDSRDELSYNCANYCADENIMRQHALHAKLNNLLWRYSMTHGGDEIDWNNKYSWKYLIYYDIDDKTFGIISLCTTRNIGNIYFCDRQTAEAAIEEIVKPFIAEHPDFDVAKM